MTDRLTNTEVSERAYGLISFSGEGAKVLLFADIRIKAAPQIF